MGSFLVMPLCDATVDPTASVELVTSVVTYYSSGIPWVGDKMSKALDPWKLACESVRAPADSSAAPNAAVGDGGEA